MIRRYSYTLFKQTILQSNHSDLHLFNVRQTPTFGNEYGIVLSLL